MTVFFQDFQLLILFPQLLSTYPKSWKTKTPVCNELFRRVEQQRQPQRVARKRCLVTQEQSLPINYMKKSGARCAGCRLHLNSLVYNFLCLVLKKGMTGIIISGLEYFLTLTSPSFKRPSATTKSGLLWLKIPFRASCNTVGLDNSTTGLKLNIDNNI